MIELGHPERATFGTDDYVSERAATQAAGRYVVAFQDEMDHADRDNVLRSVAGVTNVTSTRDLDARAMDLSQTAGADAVVFSRLGVAVVTADAGQLAALRSTRRVSVRPSRVYRALGEPWRESLSYVRGRRDEVTDLYSKLASSTDMVTSTAVTETYRDTDQVTWGLQAIGSTSRCTGRGVKVAVLDTGFDLNHPDFAGRNVTSRSFVSLTDPPGGLQRPQDGHGHGTHCTGTACGQAVSPTGRRYGVAYESEIYVGKVLDDQGQGEDASIIAGIEWALANECEILSMSLGADVREADPDYELIGHRALDAGALIIAAAGNNGNRVFGDPGFVGVPANSPSIMAAGAVDSSLRIADFSARSLPADGGQVDVVGPGVAVFSSWPLPQRYRTISGTSMATPHVAGGAAVACEATGRRGRDLWSTLIQEARRLPLPSVDVGAGLVQVARAC